VIEDSHGDWNKVGGTACWLQGDDGRGAWLWQCH
jgi:hypothetical protein